MVASRPMFHMPELQLDRATAMALAVAFNALMLMLLSLPGDPGPSNQSFIEPVEEPIMAELLPRSQPQPELEVPPPPAPPERLTPQPVLAPIIPQPTSRFIERAAEVESVVSSQELSVVSQPQARIAEPVLSREAGVDYDFAPAPPYPQISLRRGEQGTVFLRVLVRRDGEVADVQLERSSGHRDLDRAAERQIRLRWRFNPALRDGAPVDAWVRVPVQFSLQH